MELVFFTVSCRVLDLSCFGLVTKTGLITHQSFICCWTVLVQHQGLLRFSFCPTSKQAGGAQVAGRGHSKTADHMGTPYHLVLCSATKTNIVFPNETFLRDWLGINWQWAIAFASFVFSSGPTFPSLPLTCLYLGLQVFSSNWVRVYLPARGKAPQYPGLLGSAASGH